MGSWQYLYCILEGTRLPPGVYLGLEGAVVGAVAYREISAVVSALPDRHVPATRRHLVAHERLVEQLMGGGTVLPVRFGTVLADIRHVRLELSERYGVYLANLALVRGKVELGVRILAPGERLDSEEPHHQPAPAPGPGTRYLMERLRQRARSEAARRRLDGWAKRIDIRLMGHADDRRGFPPPTESMVMSAAYLVWQHGVAAFEDEVQGLREAFPGLQFLVTGPWPAYSFVGRLGRDADPSSEGETDTGGL